VSKVVSKIIFLTDLIEFLAILSGLAGIIGIMDKNDTATAFFIFMRKIPKNVDKNDFGHDLLP